MLVTDQFGAQKISRTDALGRLTNVWEVATSNQTEYPGVESLPTEVTGGLLGSAAHGYGTEYFYDILGNLRRVKQDTQQRFFAYDSLGRLVRVKNPEQGNFTPDAAGGDFPALNDETSGAPNGDWSVGYVYDANGNVLKRKDARGVVTAYGYDALNRNTTIGHTIPAGGGVAATPNVYRYYDNPVAETNGLGRLHRVAQGGSTTSATCSLQSAGGTSPSPKRHKPPGRRRARPCQ